MRVVCYRNLRRGDWSIATLQGEHGRGKVIGHMPSLVLSNVTFHVSESGRQRVCAKQCREVHAWAIGEMVDAIPQGLAARGVTYNPYRAPTFTYRDNGEPVGPCAYVEFTAEHGAIAHE